jgi:hypothetical protein
MITSSLALFWAEAQVMMNPTAIIIFNRCIVYLFDVFINDSITKEQKV